jgi:hypothetical protein
MDSGLIGSLTSYRFHSGLNRAIGGNLVPAVIPSYRQLNLKWRRYHIAQTYYRRKHSRLRNGSTARHFVPPMYLARIMQRFDGYGALRRRPRVTFSD